MDLIESPNDADDDEDREWPVRLVPTLPERERIVVERYYGLMGYSQTPMTQIAADLGVSRTMVGMIRDRALNRLRLNYARMLSA